MPTFSCLPDNRLIEIDPGETILEALLNSEVAHTSVCGGKAHCSTCRIMILEGIENCSRQTEVEKALANKLDFPVHIRLACQTKLSGYAAIRRLVIDSEDIDLVENQLTSDVVQTERPVTLLVANIRGATNFDEVNFHYDIVYIMGRYFYRMQKIVEKYGGEISNVMGRKMLVVFGLKEYGVHSVEQAIWVALEMFQAVQNLNTFLEQMRYRLLTLSIGIHYGSTVLVPLLSSPSNQLIPLGDVAATVNQIESFNQTLGTQLLVSEVAYELIKNNAVIGNKGNLQKHNSPLHVYEILGMQGTPPKITNFELVTNQQRILSFIKKFAGSWRKPI